MNERAFRSRFTDLLRFPKTTIIQVEPRPGIPPGQPDLIIQASFHYYPVELKYGNDPVKGLDPFQRQWFKLAAVRGAPVFLGSLNENEEEPLCTFSILGKELQPVLSRNIKFKTLNHAKLSIALDEMILYFPKGRL